MRRLLRGIRGPHADGVYIIERGTTLGRAGHVDVQIVDVAVSREHARVFVDATGRTIVTDLSSRNGTRVNERQIGRHVLTRGDVVQVGSARYLYDETDDPTLTTSKAFRSRLSTGPSLAQTEALPAVAAAPPVSKRGTSPGLARPPLEARGPKETSPATQRELPVVGPAAADAPERDTVEVTRPVDGRAATRELQRMPHHLPTAPRGPGLHAPGEWEQFARAAATHGLELEQGSAADIRLEPDPEPPDSPAPAESGRFDPPAPQLSALDPWDLESFRDATAPRSPMPATGDDEAPRSRRRRRNARPRDPDVDERVHRAIDTVLRFRVLRTRESAGEALRLDERERLRRLENLLRSAGVSTPRSNRRRWVRIPVDLPGEAAAEVSASTRPAVPITIEDISAGGLRFWAEDGRFSPGDTVSLRIRIDHGLLARDAVFEGEVVWADAASHDCGAVFVGPGHWET